MANIRWTKEKIITDAAKYSSKSAWQKSSPSAYNIAIYHGWLTEATAHMSRPAVHNKKWTKDTVLDEAKKYKTKAEWIKKNHASYNAAKKYGVFNLAVSHMEIKRNKWANKDAILKEANRYKNKTEWHLKSFSYEIARLNGWLNEACLHMTHGINSSKSEADLLSEIQEIYPKAHKAWFGRKIGIGNSFELDVYIPELHKGVEFNGDYFHSLEGLRRSRPNWPEEKLAKYHDIKREFFKAIGIDYIEIWEFEWEKDKEFCLSRVFDFLNPK